MDKSENKLNINISTGTVIRIIVIFVVAFLLYKMLDLVLVVLTSVVIASAIEPIIKWFGKYKAKRLFAVIVTYICVILVFSSLLYFFIPPVLDEATNLLSNMPQYLDTLTLWNPLSNNSLTDTNQIISNVSDSLRNFTSNISDNIIGIASSIFGGALSFILIIVLSFYLAVQEGGVEKFLCIITPLKNEAYIINLWKRSQQKIGYWMQGQLLLGIVVGVLVYLGLVILGVENALFLAVLAGVLEIIPLFGPVIAAIPAVLFAFVGGGITSAILVIGLFIIIQQFENHLIYPLVVKKVVGISPILVILTLIIGAKLAGFLGILLSVPITAALMEFINDVQKDKKINR
jgi:predicted PurR-regulated permease PerM